MSKALRSLLFVPGDSERKLDKATGVGADALILDLEDSVAAGQKDSARRCTGAFLKSHADGCGADDAPNRPEICVRINSLDTAFWQEDLDAISANPPGWIILPKARSGEDVTTLTTELDARELRDTRLIVLVTEEPISLLRLDTYVGCSDRLAALTWGAEDLSAVVGAEANRQSDGTFTAPYQLARNLCLFTAAAARVPAIDTVFTNFRDQAGLEREARTAARDGFTGKLAIHPEQVAPINAAFTPSPAQVAHAEAVLAAFAAAEPGSGVVSLDGEMLDEPHRRLATRVIGRARS